MATPDIYTRRFYFDYSNAVSQHTMLVRVLPEVDLSVFWPIMDSFFTQVSQLTASFQIDQVRQGEPGSTFTFPVVTGLEGNTYGDTLFPADANSNPRALSFVGRDGLGVRGRLFVYGAQAQDNNYRITSAENTVVADLVNFLNERESTFVTITGNANNWNSYANLKANDYWVRRSRGG